MRSIIQVTPAYELSADITTTAHGHGLKLISFVPGARHPEDHTQFQGVFSSAELNALREFLDRALEPREDRPGLGADGVRNP